MVRVTALLALASSGCAQLLSYDDYAARENATDSSLDVTVEAAVDSAMDAAEAGPMPVRIPARPTAAKTPSGKGKTMWLAVRKFKLGSVDLTGGKDEDAWRTLGFDLDGLCTSLADSAADMGMCIRPSGATQDSLEDGDGCRDNNFGHHIGTLLRSAAPDTEPTLDARVEAGQRTWVLEIQDADEGDDGYAPGRLWGVRDERSTGVTVKWDGTDVRMATDESVTGGDLQKPLVTFPNGFIRDDKWVSGEEEDVTYTLPMTNEYLVPMRLQRSSFVIGLDADRGNGHQGTLAGVFDQPAMEAMINELVRYAGSCPGSLLYMTALSSSLRAFDVTLGAKNWHDPTKTCDALTVAMGVDVRAVQPLAAVAPPRKVPADPCAPADAGGD